MDFASILGSEIKKRKTTTTASSSTSSTITSKPDSYGPPPKKYLKRSEIEAQRREEYLAEQARLEKERAERAERKRKLELEEEERREAMLEKKRRLAEESRRKREEEEQARKAREEAKLAAQKGENAEKAESTPSTEDSTTTTESNLEEEISDAEAITRLRALSQPILLFGETPLQRLKRLRKLESGNLPSNPNSNRSRTRSHTPTIAEPPSLTESEMLISLPDVTTNPSKVYTQLTAWFKLVLREWDIALASRPASVKESFQGKQAYNAYRQAHQYMQPLFRHLKQNDLHTEIFTKVCDIVHHAQNRKYVTANDVYLRLSIGNAAWPIGVTMVGIHERSAREKLHEKGMAAHIMSDEVTRKFLQSIKRCLSFCQVRWPPEDQLQLMG